jgi:peptide/nickel transport system substrate-binding protein
MAIDREAMTERLLQGLGTAGSTVIPPMYADLHLTPASGVEYDPVLAGQLLDEAGYPLGPDGVRVGSDGQPLTLRFFGRSDGDADSEKILEYIQAYFADVGVTLETNLVSTDVIITKYGEGKYDLYEWGWGVEPDPNYMLSAFTCANRSYEDEGAIYSTLSDSFYCNEEYDALWEAQSTETDSVRRAEIVRQMQQMLIDDMPYLVLYYPDQLSAYRSDRFAGFIPQPRENGAILFQYGTWTWDALAPVTAEAAASEGASASASASGEGSSASTPTSESGGSSTLPFIVIGVVVVAIGVGVVLFLRRRSSADLRE